MGCVTFMLTQPNLFIRLRLKRHDTIIKLVGLGLSHLVQYSYLDITQIQHANPSWHPYSNASLANLLPLLPLKQSPPTFSSSSSSSHCSNQLARSIPILQFLAFALFPYFVHVCSGQLLKSISHRHTHEALISAHPPTWIASFRICLL